MGTDKPLFPPHRSSPAALFAYLTQTDPAYEFVPSYHVDPVMQNEKFHRHCANPILASQCSRYSSARVGSGSPKEIVKVAHSNTDGGINEDPKTSWNQAQDVHDQSWVQKFDKNRFDVAIHPEGLPYFYQDKLVTYDNMDDPHIKKLLENAVALVSYMLKHMKDMREDFTFHEEVELCIELKTVDYPPKFNYYIADHSKRIIFWADSREPESIQKARGPIRDNHLSLKDAATSEGSTSPMSAKDIALHIANLDAFGEESNTERTWAIGLSLPFWVTDLSR
ncbi:hypothetical protein OPQ81_010631 [Rhizoctonia solani]|nr:hypothetical protein OPQ81_010631 [Rhizoctonia solani]